MNILLHALLSRPLNDDNPTGQIHTYTTQCTLSYLSKSKLQINVRIAVQIQTHINFKCFCYMQNGFSQADVAHTVVRSIPRLSLLIGNTKRCGTLRHFARACVCCIVLGVQNVLPAANLHKNIILILQ